MHGTANDWARTAQTRPPRVSVVIPTRNRPQLLVEALATVRAQRFTDYEVIIVSNGERNSIATRQIAAQYGCRLIVLAEGNRSHARNVAANEARGEWVALLDDDDLWHRNKLMLQVAFAEETGADCVFTDIILRDSQGNDREHRVGPCRGLTVAESMMIWRCGSGGCSTVLVRRQALLALGGFDTSMTLAEDWDMWRRISQSYSVAYLDEVLAVCRTHGINGEVHHYLRPWFCTYWEIYHAVKAIRTCPRDLRHMIPGTLRYILKRAIVWHTFFVLMGSRSERAWATRLRKHLRPRTRINAILNRKIF